MSTPEMVVQLPLSTRRDALERVFNGLSMRRPIDRPADAVPRRKDVQYSNGLNKSWAPGRRVYPSAVAATI
jgi:hypothetical protein